MEPWMIAALIGASLLLNIPLVIWAIKKQAARNRQLQEALGSLADETSGSVEPATSLKRAELQFPHRQQQASLTHHSTGGKHPVFSTHLRLNLEGLPHFELRIYAEHAFSGLGSLLGFQDVQIGDPDFDKTFVLKTADEDCLRNFLDEQTRATLLALHRQHLPGGASLFLQGGALILSLRGWLDTPEKLREFLSSGRGVLDAYLRTLVEGPGAAE